MISRVSVVICLLCIAALRQRLASSWQEDVRRYVQSKEWDAVMAIVDAKSPAVRWRVPENRDESDVSACLHSCPDPRIDWNWSGPANFAG